MEGNQYTVVKEASIYNEKNNDIRSQYRPSVFGSVSGENSTAWTGQAILPIGTVVYGQEEEGGNPPEVNWVRIIRVDGDEYNQYGGKFLKSRTEGGRFKGDSVTILQKEPLSAAASAAPPASAEPSARPASAEELPGTASLAEQPGTASAEELSGELTNIPNEEYDDMFADLEPVPTGVAGGTTDAVLEWNEELWKELLPRPTEKDQKILEAESVIRRILAEYNAAMLGLKHIVDLVRNDEEYQRHTRVAQQYHEEVLRLRKEGKKERAMQVFVLEKRSKESAKQVAQLVLLPHQMKLKSLKGRRDIILKKINKYGQQWRAGCTSRSIPQDECYRMLMQNKSIPNFAKLIKIYLSHSKPQRGGGGERKRKRKSKRKTQKYIKKSKRRKTTKRKSKKKRTNKKKNYTKK